MNISNEKITLCIFNKTRFFVYDKHKLKGRIQIHSCFDYNFFCSLILSFNIVIYLSFIIINNIVKKIIEGSYNPVIAMQNVNNITLIHLKVGDFFYSIGS